MLPVYKATKFIQILELGGHTKPWLIEVEVENSAKMYVIKVYSTQQIESRNCVTAEVIGNILAQSFDLFAPNAALIDISDTDFQMSLSPNAHFLLESNKIDERIKFGTEYIPDCRKADIDIPKEIYENSLELDTLYAFDNFIRNEDRGQSKTNLLIHNETQEIWLIDHEFALQDINEENLPKMLQDIENQQWRATFTRYHFAYFFLKNENKNVKSQYFRTFLEYLRYLELSKLKSYFRQLESYDYDTESESILEYLTFIKNNPTLFLNILQQSLQ